MFYWPLVIFLADINADSIYRAVNSCVFNPLQSIFMNSRLQCALKCDLAECKAFQHNRNQSMCRLYSFREICQSNTACLNVTIFINNRYNNLFEGNSTGVAFQLLGGINWKYGDGPPSIFEIFKGTQAMPLIKGDWNATIMATSTYMNSRIIALPKYEMVTDPAKSPLRKMFLNYLTGGKCIEYSECYCDVFDYENCTGNSSLVIGIPHFMPFSSDDLIKYASTKNWSYIVAGTFWMPGVSLSVRKLLNHYGINPINKKDSTDWMIRGNICRDIPNY